MKIRPERDNHVIDGRTNSLPIIGSLTPRKVSPADNIYRQKFARPAAARVDRFLPVYFQPGETSLRKGAIL